MLFITIINVTLLKLLLPLSWIKVLVKETVE